MTDNEIIKVLECCINKGAKCSDCPAFKKVDRSDCKKYFRGALDLINRQQAEIDETKHEIEICESIYKKDAKEVEHGEWINGLFCSVCGYLYDTGEYANAHNYCPNCGAKMDGDV